MFDRHNYEYLNDLEVIKHISTYLIPLGCYLNHKHVLSDCKYVIDK